jgi:hypothetical protein
LVVLLQAVADNAAASATAVKPGKYRSPLP